MGEKLQPQLRFPGFEGDWERFNLKDIAKFSKGKNISKSEVETNGKYECIRYGELYTKYNEVIDFVHSRTNLEAKNLVFSEANDIIIPASGESAIDIATASCVIRKGIALGGDLNIIKTKENGVFLSYYLNSSKKHEIAKKSQGISVIHIYGDHLKSLSINLPPLHEQQKIADYLSTIDTKINLLGEKKTELSRYKKAMMQKLFSREIRFKDENGKDFPDWEEKILGEIVDVRDGTHDSPKYISKSKYFLITSKNLNENGYLDYNNISYLKEEDYLKINKRSIVEENDILFGMIGTIGNPVIVRGQVNFAIKNMALLKQTDKINTYFLYQMFRSDYIKNLFKRFNTGNTQKFVSLSLIRNLIILYPHLSEQQKIADFLSAIDESINKVEERIKEMQAFKKAMLQQMFI